MHGGFEPEQIRPAAILVALGKRFQRLAIELDTLWHDWTANKTGFPVYMAKRLRTGLQSTISIFFTWFSLKKVLLILSYANP